MASLSTLVIKHADIDPNEMVRLGRYPSWLDEFVPHVSLESTVEVRYMNLQCDPQNVRMITAIAKASLQGCTA